MSLLIQFTHKVTSLFGVKIKATDNWKLYISSWCFCCCCCYCKKNSKLPSFSLKMLVKSAQNRSLSSEICPENSHKINHFTNHFSAKFALGKVLLIWQGGGGRRDEDIETWSLKFWQLPLLVVQFFRSPPNSYWFWSIHIFGVPPPPSPTIFGGPPQYLNLPLSY